MASPTRLRFDTSGHVRRSAAPRTDQAVQEETQEGQETNSQEAQIAAGCVAVSASIDDHIGKGRVSLRREHA